MNTIKRLAFTLAALLVPTTGLAGQAEAEQSTAAAALIALRGLEAADARGSTAGTREAVAVLRQTLDRRSPEELDAFARDLVDLIREGPPWQARAAHAALIQSAIVYDDAPERGAPYAGAAQAFIGLYESYADPTGTEAEDALYGVFQTGGVQYVRDLYDASERPPECQYPSQTMVEGPDGTRVFEKWEDLANPCPNKSTWCIAGGLLTMYADEGPDLENWEWLCTRKRF